jgi:hypothetical protein
MIFFIMCCENSELNQRLEIGRKSKKPRTDENSYITSLYEYHLYVLPLTMAFFAEPNM